MTDGGYSKTEAWNLQLQAQISGMRAAAEEIDTVVRDVELRCMAADGPVASTLQVITEEEFARVCRAAIRIRTAAPSVKGTPAAGVWMPTELSDQMVEAALKATGFMENDHNRKALRRAWEVMRTAAAI